MRGIEGRALFARAYLRLSSAGIGARPHCSDLCDLAPVAVMARCQGQTRPLSLKMRRLVRVNLSLRSRAFRIARECFKYCYSWQILAKKRGQLTTYVGCYN